MRLCRKLLTHNPRPSFSFGNKTSFVIVIVIVIVTDKRGMFTTSLITFVPDRQEFCLVDVGSLSVYPRFINLPWARIYPMTPPAHHPSSSSPFRQEVLFFFFRVQTHVTGQTMAKREVLKKKIPTVILSTKKKNKGIMMAHPLFPAGSINPVCMPGSRQSINHTRKSLRGKKHSCQLELTTTGHQQLAN
jgi:hypothetical protein